MFKALATVYLLVKYKNSLYSDAVNFHFIHALGAATQHAHLFLPVQPVHLCSLTVSTVRKGCLLTLLSVMWS